VASQLAVTAAATGRRRILLVDANLAQPLAHRILHVDAEPGLADVLADAGRMETAVQPTGVSNLFVLAAGSTKAYAGDVQEANTVDAVVKRAADEYDLAVFDLPASGQPGFAPRLAALLDGLLLVVEAERVRWDVARRTSELLRRADVRLLGAVLNKRRQHVPSWLYRML
jgi:Mrp family chromosome partitioning ATPase